MLQLLFLRCHPCEKCKHQNLKKYKIPFFVHFVWRDSGCRGNIPCNCFFFTPILASIRALYFWLAIFSLIGDWEGLLTVNKDIPCCFKPGTLSNKCTISVMKILHYFQYLFTYKFGLQSCCFTKSAALSTKVEKLEAIEGCPLCLFATPRFAYDSFW